MLRKMLVLGLVGVVAVAFAACGDDDDATPTQAPGGAATTAGGSAKIAVVASDFAFSPAKFDVKAGAASEITLSNNGQAPHSFGVYSDKEFKTKVDSGTIATTSPGARGTANLTPPAGATALFFRCEVHPAQMQGEIAVK
jgi:plastocyanin